MLQCYSLKSSHLLLFPLSPMYDTHRQCSVTTWRDRVGRVWVRGSGWRGHKCAYGWLKLMYGKNNHNIVIILQLKYINFKNSLTFLIHFKLWLFKVQDFYIWVAMKFCVYANHTFSIIYQQTVCVWVCMYPLLWTKSLCPHQTFTSWSPKSQCNNR